MLIEKNKMNERTRLQVTLHIALLVYLALSV